MRQTNLSSRQNFGRALLPFDFVYRINVRLQLSPSGEVNMAYIPTSTSAPASGGSVLPPSTVPDSQSRRPSVAFPSVFVSRTYSSFISPPVRTYCNNDYSCISVKYLMSLLYLSGVCV